MPEVSEVLKSAKDSRKKTCFLAIPNLLRSKEVFFAISSGVKRANYIMITPDIEDSQFYNKVRASVFQEILSTDCIIADMSINAPDVYFYLGIAMATGKNILLLFNEQVSERISSEFSDNFRTISYQDDEKSLASLTKNIAISLREFRRFPRRSRLSNIGITYPFFIDWERLNKRDIENLCQELLAQMGFRRLQWENKFSPAIDLTAELPRKDPDGFEYQEFWLIKIGFKEPRYLLEDFLYHPEQFLFKELKYSERFERFRNQSPYITILVILLDEYFNISNKEIDRARISLNRLYDKEDYRGIGGFENFRLRIWDRVYLTSLIQRFPQIGYKYFSEEGRIRSKTRKSYEELYLENSNLVGQQAKLIADLEDEKNRRIRAERDTIWRDISFSAAHKIGNPIFAIETDIDPLGKRIREDRIAEAEDVMKNIRSSVEKAKAIIEQFKSLARAQEIKLVSMPLKPIIDGACGSLGNQDIICNVKCPADLKIDVDPDKLGECFDELIANATHWFDKPEKKIEISVISPAPEPLPSSLESNSNYVLIRVEDNGCGIPVSNKNKIFDAFFTTSDHGTGLGLALVRRIIEGHNGGIFETGIPGQGADFQIYIPISKKGDQTAKG